MGSPAEEKQKLVEMMNQTINNIEMRRRELNANLDKEQDDKKAAEIKKELDMLETEASAVKGARDEYEQQYARLKTDEERKKLERIVKMAIIVGIANESIRVAWEKQKQLESDREAARQEREQLRKERYEKAIDRIFETMTLKYVTRDMIDEIKENKKFKEMAESDPDRLNREEMVKKDEYIAMMAETFHRNSIKMTGDFKKDEAQLKKLYEEKPNGFEKTSPGLKKFIEGNLEKYGTIEEKNFFKKLFVDILEAGATTRKLRFDFVTGESDFVKGNGYTKDVYDKEQSIISRIKEYKDKVMAENLKLAENYDEEKMTGRMAIYNQLVTLEGDIAPTVHEDESHYHNNEFRKETEMWKVYQKLPAGSIPTVKHVTEKANNEMRAWNKVQRMSKIAMIEGIGGITGNMYDFAKDNAQNIYENAINKKKLSAEDKAQIKENCAAIIYNQLVYNEQKSSIIEKPFSERVQFINKEKNDLDNVAKDFAKTEVFTKIFNKYIKGGNYRDKCIRFLTEDVEKQMAAEIAEKREKLLSQMPQQPVKPLRRRNAVVQKGKGMKLS